MNVVKVSSGKIIAAWLVHLLTASGAIVGLFSIEAIYHQHYILAFWLIGVAIVIDAIDGTFARWIKVKIVLPQINGELLDNIVDYLNYVIVPALFLLTSPLLAEGARAIAASMICLASAYQFCQADAKTSDHFFKGFPSYWNIIVFYLYFWQINAFWNFIIISLLTVLIFIPIKYVYPSRLEYLTNNKVLRTTMLMATILWGLATLSLLWIYPKTNWFLVGLSMGYLILYLLVSLYRTFNLTFKNQRLKMMFLEVVNKNKYR
jgi:phosphatidylcholine synthase